MKPITLISIIGLTVFTAFGANAQDKSCSCKNKMAHHRTIHKKTTNKTAMAATKTKQRQACITYTPPLLPAGIYNSMADSNNLNIMSDNTWLGFYSNTAPEPDVTETMSYGRLTITSSAFKDYGVLPAKYTCEGSRVSPPLTINNIPPETQSLAIVIYDPEATSNSSMTYWLMWNVDTTSSIPENFVTDHMGMNSAKEYGYQAVCPIKGTHYYHFIVYALDTKILAGKNTNKAMLERDMAGHILAKGEMIGVYNKHID